MKKSIFALILTLCLTFAALALSVQADTALKLTVSASGGDYTTVEKALAAVETMAKNGELGEKGVILELKGTHTATTASKLLFGQKTIFLPDGTKLPITITGGTLNLPAESIVCANDYTFQNISIPFDDVATKLFAGSGSVTLENITTNLNSKASEYKSQFYADNFSANAFTGWTEKSLALYSENGLFVSSMTLGEGFSYNCSNNLIAAVGSSTDFSAQVGTKTISADDTCPKLIVDGAYLNHPFARTGTNPAANSVLILKSGSVGHIYAIPKNSTKATVRGDVTVLVDGIQSRSFVRLIQNADVYGNVNVSLKNLDLSGNSGVADGMMIEIGFGGSVSVFGDINVDMENVKADRYYGSLGGKSQKVTGDITVNVKNSEFTRFYRSGFSQATVCGSVENNLENVNIGPNYRGLDDCYVLGKADEYTGKKNSVGNLVNNLKNVTFAEATTEDSMQLGSVSTCEIAGNITNTLENVVTQGKLVFYCGSYSGTVKGDITNTVKSGSFSHYFYGANYNGSIEGTVRNYIQGGTYYNEVFLGGHSCTIKGKIENHVSGGNFDTLYLFCGTRGGNANNKSIPYAIENYFTGGSFVGVWGGGGNTTASVLTGNIYNEISGGHFGVYNYTGKINSFAGSVRNGTHNGNVDTLIRGGTFEGYVFGGSIPNQEDWGHSHDGVSTLTVAGGEFLYHVDANSRWGAYKESHLYVNTEKAIQPLTTSYDMVCDSFIAAGEAPILQSYTVTCRDLIARGKGALQVCGTVVCDNFIVEAGAASPEIYGTVNAKNMTTADKTVIIGAKGNITASSVTGKVHLYQTEYWLARTYLTSPASTAITLSTATEAYGEGIIEGGIVTGKSAAFEGVAFVFDSTISLRFFFNKEPVDQAKDSFSFSATCGDRTIAANVTYDKLVLRDGYYTVLSDVLSAAELCETITATSPVMETRSFTLLDLAEAGIRIYAKDSDNKELGDLLKAFSNYAVASDNYKNGKSTALPYENLAQETNFTVGDGYAPLVEAPLVQIVNKQLILDGGMRIRYYLESGEMLATMRNDSAVNDLHYFYNCDDITSTVKKTWVSTTSRKGYFEITVDLPVAAAKSKDAIRFIVSTKSTLSASLPADSTAPYTTYVSEDYIDRLDCFAEQLSMTEGSEELGSALLYYLQAGAEYYDTQPDITDFTYPTEFSAGYAREDFSPYGYNMDMYSDRFGSVVLDPMYVTCLALWDGDELALIYSLDFRGASDSFTTEYKSFLVDALKGQINPDMIFFNATHNHSGPNASSMSSATVVTWYETIFDDALLRATKRAILDLAPTELYSGTALSDPGTNYVRRYVNADGSVTGIHNEIPANNVVAYETEADKELRTMRFVREGKKDIVYANWQGHAAHGAAYKYQFTADFVGFLRDGVEADMGVDFIYCNGASGNLNFTPKVQEDIDAKYFTSPYFSGVGKSLVGTVKKAVKAEKKINTGDFQVTRIPFLATVKHEDDATVAKAKEANELLKAYKAEHGSDMPASQIQAKTDFQSKYEISHIITRSGMGETATITVFAFSFGDVGMAFVPYEQFDSNAKQIRDGVADLFEVTFTSAYSNGSKSYIPSAYAAPHGGYEVYSSRYVDSTGDDIAFALVDALRAMKK